MSRGARSDSTTTTIIHRTKCSAKFSAGSFASRGTLIGGNAVRFAAEQARERILEIASKELEIAPADLDIVEEGYGFLRQDGLLPGPHDIYVSQSQIRRFALRIGDMVTGQVRPKLYEPS